MITNVYKFTFVINIYRLQVYYVNINYRNDTARTLRGRRSSCLRGGCMRSGVNAGHGRVATKEPGAHGRSERNGVCTRPAPVESAGRGRVATKEPGAHGRNERKGKQLRSRPRRGRAGALFFLVINQKELLSMITTLFV